MLAGYSFLIGIFQAYYISLANASFLAEFGVDYLPQGYIVTGIVGYLIGTWLAGMQRRLPFTRLIVYVLALPLALLVAFRLGFWLAPSKWLAFAMFTCIGPFLALIYFVLRSLVGQLFDLRQSKRLYGLISTGDVISAILGFFSVPVFISLFGNVNDLLLIAAGALGLAWLLINLINRQFAEELSTNDTSSNDGEERPQANIGFVDLFRRRYFLLIALLAMLVMVGFYYIDYAFLAQLRIRFADKAFLARFISLFYGIIRIVELLVKTFLSGRLLSHYGMKFGLASVPVMLCISTGLAALFSLGLSAGGHAVFLLMALSKMIERVAIKSFHDPSFNILYQPLDREIRLSVQTRIEGIIQQGVVGIAGGTLWLFSWTGSFNVVVIALVLVVACWTVATILVYREYRVSLLDNLAERARLRAESERVGPSSIEILGGLLQESGFLRGAYLLDWLARLSPAEIGTFLRSGLGHVSARVRRELWQVAGALRFLPVHQEEARLENETEEEVRRVGLQVLRQLEEEALKGRDAKGLRRLSEAPETAQRLLALRLLEAGGEDIILDRLLGDREALVRRQALVTAGRRGESQWWSSIVTQLASPQAHHVAAAVLREKGEEALVVLEEFWAQAGQQREVAARATRLCAQVGGEQVKSLLLNRLSIMEVEVKTEALDGLRLCGFRAVSTDELGQVEQRLEEAVDDTAWAMAGILDLESEERGGDLRRQLGLEIDALRERIFSLLELVHESQQIGLVRDSFKSGSGDGRIYALELLDVLLAPSVREMLFPVLEDLTLNQRLRRLEDHFPQQRLSAVERLKDIVNCEYSRASRWTRVCALHALAGMDGNGVFDEQLAQLFNPDPLLHESAGKDISAGDPTVFSQYAEKLPRAIRSDLLELLSMPERKSIFEKVLLLKKTGVLKGVAEVRLALLADYCEVGQFPAGSAILEEGKQIDRAYLLVDGSVEVRGERGALEQDEPGLLDALVWTPEGVSEGAVIAARDTTVISVNRDVLAGFLAEHAEAARGLAEEISR